VGPSDGLAPMHGMRHYESPSGKLQVRRRSITPPKIADRKWEVAGVAVGHFQMSPIRTGRDEGAQNIFKCPLSKEAGMKGHGTSALLLQQCVCALTCACVCAYV